MFRDREEAGRALAQVLRKRRYASPVVVALPRGGVPVAAQVARALHAPLDLLLVRKIGAPGNPEFAVGAVAEGTPPIVVVDDALRASGEDDDFIVHAAAEQLKEIERRRSLYLRGAAREPLAGRTVILVDDGLATGATVRAALQALRRRNPASVVLAVPVGPADTVQALRASVDDLVCLQQPTFFGGVGEHYADFHQVGDAEVIASLDGARRAATAAAVDKHRA
jgi:putative phosphoribosyl transferase